MSNASAERSTKRQGCELSPLGAKRARSRTSSASVTKGWRRAGRSAAGKLAPREGGHETLQRIAPSPRPPRVRELVAVGVELHASWRLHDRATVKQQLERLGSRDTGAQMTRHG